MGTFNTLFEQWEKIQWRNKCECNLDEMVGICMEGEVPSLSVTLKQMECVQRPFLQVSSIYPTEITLFPSPLWFYVTHIPTASLSFMGQVRESSLKATYMLRCCPGNWALASWTANCGRAQNCSQRRGRDLFSAVFSAVSSRFISTVSTEVGHEGPETIGGEKSSLLTYSCMKLHCS